MCVCAYEVLIMNEYLKQYTYQTALTVMCQNRWIEVFKS